jgi:cytosine permease
MGGASLTLVANVADICRYTPTRRDMRIGLVGSSLASAVVTTFVGAYAAVATGKTNPFVAVVDLTSSKPLLALLIVAIVAQGFAANIMNVYTAGLSLVNSVPALGRLRATFLVAIAAVTLSAFPSFVDHAQRWITHLGNVAAPLTGALLADYLLVQRSRIDVPALFDPDGRYRYLRGVNVAAVGAVAIGVGVYYALPQSWFKLVWGVGVSAVAYLGLRALEAVLVSGRARVSHAVAE